MKMQARNQNGITLIDLLDGYIEYVQKGGLIWLEIDIYGRHSLLIKHFFYYCKQCFEIDQNNIIRVRTDPIYSDKIPKMHSGKLIKIRVDQFSTYYIEQFLKNPVFNRQGLTRSLKKYLCPIIYTSGGIPNRNIYMPQIIRKGLIFQKTIYI